MKQRILTTTMVFSLSLFTAQSMMALPFHHMAASGVGAVKVKMISFHVRNDSGASMTIKAGDQQVTISPGKTIDLKLQDAEQVTAVNATHYFAAGQVVTTVSQVLQGNTLVLL